MSGRLMPPLHGSISPELIQGGVYFVHAHKRARRGLCSPSPTPSTLPGPYLPRHRHGKRLLPLWGRVCIVQNHSRAGPQAVPQL
jgi:hypothetical protein